MKERFSIPKQELKALIFWATIGANGANGGSYDRILPDIIAKYSKQLGLYADSFCGLGYKSKILGKYIINVLNEKAGLRIKINK